SSTCLFIPEFLVGITVFGRQASQHVNEIVRKALFDSGKQISDLSRALIWMFCKGLAAQFKFQLRRHTRFFKRIESSIEIRRIYVSRQFQAETSEPLGFIGDKIAEHSGKFPSAPFQELTRWMAIFRIIFLHRLDPLLISHFFSSRFLDRGSDSSPSNPRR